MRYALICAGVMLAVLLVWPLAFARPATISARPDLPAAVSIPIPPAKPAVIRASLHPRAFDAPVDGGPSCFARYQKVFDACSGDEAEACRLVALDRWDRCETSGRWPR